MTARCFPLEQTWDGQVLQLDESRTVDQWSAEIRTWSALGCWLEFSRRFDSVSWRAARGSCVGFGSTKQEACENCTALGKAAA